MIRPSPRARVDRAPFERARGRSRATIASRARRARRRVRARAARDARTRACAARAINPNIS